MLSKFRRAAEQGDAVHVVEEMTWSGLIETGRELIVAYIKQQEEDIPRPKVIEHEGKTLHRLPRRRRRPYVSAFGPTPFYRHVYAQRETQRQEVVPLDAKLGMPEGVCRHLVKDRMEQTGMRWRIAGAQAVLSLRAIYVNDDWEPFHAHRIRAEQRKLYPYKRRLLPILNCAT
jgi:hypothetical protein